MALAEQLSSSYNGFHSSAPKDISNTIKTATVAHKTEFNPHQAIQVGDTLPAFSLPDATGKTVNSRDLLSQSGSKGLLVSFYRGEWCPFCSLELKALQSRLADFQAKGVTLVAISPELPDTSLSTSEKLALKFPVLSDVGAKYARELKLVFEQPDSMWDVFNFAGIEWEKRYGSRSLVVPVPATILVDGQGKVRNVFVDANYHERLEPEEALGWVEKL